MLDCRLKLVRIEHFTYEGAVRSDSLGMDGIVYFPRLPWVDQCEECGDYACQRPACREEEAPVSAQA